MALDAAVYFGNNVETGARCRLRSWWRGERGRSQSPATNLPAQSLHLLPNLSSNIYPHIPTQKSKGRSKRRPGKSKLWRQCSTLRTKRQAKQRERQLDESPVRNLQTISMSFKSEDSLVRSCCFIPSSRTLALRVQLRLLLLRLPCVL